MATDQPAFVPTGAGASTNIEADIEAEDLAFVKAGRSRRAAIMRKVDQQPTLFYMSLTLLDNQRELEWSWLDTIQPLSKACSGILLVLPSLYEVPDALEYSLVRRILERCEQCGLSVYLARDLWVVWPDRSFRKQRHRDVDNRSYYATYLATIAAEARAIGAAGTWVQCEPNGQSIFKETWKADGFRNWYEREEVFRAIRRALPVAPPVTMVYPAGGQNPDHYSWTLQDLGEQALFSKSYYADGPDQVYATSPGSQELQVHWWGTNVTSAMFDGGPGQRRSIAQYNALDWAAIKAAYPELIGNWIYADRAERKQVMELLGETAK